MELNGKNVLYGTVLVGLGVAIFVRNRRPLLFEIAPKVPMDVSLGTPGTGIHSHRFLGMAYRDFLATFVIAAVCTILSKGSLNAWLIIWLIIGEIEHMYFGIPTETFKWFFTKP